MFRVKLRRLIPAFDWRRSRHRARVPGSSIEHRPSTAFRPPPILENRPDAKVLAVTLGIIVML